MEQNYKWYKQNKAFLERREKMGILSLLWLYCTPFGWVKLATQGKPIKADEFDARVNAQVQEAKKASFGFLGVVPEQVNLVKPMVLSNYTRYRTNSGDTRVSLFNWDKDSRVRRASDYKTTICFFSETQVFMYQRSFSMIEPSVEDESSEYFYNDIQNIQVTHSCYDPEYMAQQEALRSGGLIGMLTSRKKSRTEDEESIVEFDAFKIISGVGGVTGFFQDNPEAKKSIIGMKNLIREKKTAANNR